MATPRIGTAGWSIPRAFKAKFSREGSHLERYARTFNAVEINSSFHRDHQASTFARWRESVPKDFRFSVKLSKIFTHEKRLKVSAKSLRENLIPILELGDQLGAVLVQLPPSLPYDAKATTSFIQKIRRVYNGPLVFEPRHASWFGIPARQAFKVFGVSHVLADPDKFGGKHVIHDMAYFRLHGSPDMYRSKYSAKDLRRFGDLIADYRSAGKFAWCIFDNTTLGYATGNALSLQKRIS